MSKTLIVNITSMNPDKFKKDSSSTATNATVTESGDIDISLVEDSVEISWKIGATVNETFRPISPPPGPIKFQTIDVPPTEPPAGVFGSPSLSDDKKTVTVTDENPSNATKKIFTYTLYETPGPDDPRVTNR